MILNLKPNFLINGLRSYQFIWRMEPIWKSKSTILEENRKTRLQPKNKKKKFLDLCKNSLANDRANKILASAVRLENAQQINRLTNLLR